MSIGSRIREARKHSGLTQKELADKVGMKQPTLSELETGESAGTTNVASIAAALGVNALWLETGKGAATFTAGQNSLGENIPIITYIQRTSEEEAQLLEMYRLLDDEWRLRLIQSAKGMPKLNLPLGSRNKG